MALDPTTSPLTHPWGPVQLSAAETTAVRLGPRDLWLRAQDGEVWIAHDEVGTPRVDLARQGRGEARAEPPEEVEWSRWATPSGETEVQLRPTFPDRALVLQPERAFQLLPGARARVYVRVPLWVRIELPLAGGGSSLLLEEIPTLEMSDTWWGDFLEGELCYWLTTTARREMRPHLFAPHLAVCPLHLHNTATTDLQVDKLTFRVAHLSLFQREGELWADESRVLYQGESEGSQVTMAGRSPEEAEGAVLVASPRTPALRSFRARTFDRIKGFPGIGGAS